MLPGQCKVSVMRHSCPECTTGFVVNQKMASLLPVSFAAVVSKLGGFPDKDPIVRAYVNAKHEIAKKVGSRLASDRTPERFVRGLEANKPTTGLYDGRYVIFNMGLKAKVRMINPSGEPETCSGSNPYDLMNCNTSARRRRSLLKLLCLYSTPVTLSVH